MGPVSTVIHELSKELGEIGHDVEIADARASERTTALRIMELDVPPRDGSDTWEKERALTAALAKRDLRRFDIVHTHEWPTSYYLHRHGIRTVYTAHTPIWTSFTGLRLLTDRLRRLVLPHEYKVIQDSLLTVALGDYLRVKDANIAVIPSGIRTEDWPPLQRNRGVFTVLFVGRIVPVKGVHVLVEALRRLPFEYRAVFVGPPAEHSRDSKDATPYARRVQAEAREMPVTFTGFVDNRSRQFREYVSQAHVLVVPSLFDAQGLVVLEALAKGLPVIASDVGGIGMMVSDKVGRLVPPSDAAALARAITELHDNPNVLQAMASCARDHVVRNFSWRACAEAYSAAMQRSLRAS